MATWRDVRRIALALPGVSEEATSSGNSAWIVNKKFFTWERPLRKSDLVRTADLEMKEVLAWLARAGKRAVAAFLKDSEKKL